MVCSISSFISYWAGLQLEEDKMRLQEGAEVLKATAIIIIWGRSSATATKPLDKKKFHNVALYRCLPLIS